MKKPFLIILMSFVFLVVFFGTYLVSGLTIDTLPITSYEQLPTSPPGFLYLDVFLLGFGVGVGGLMRVVTKREGVQDLASIVLLVGIIFFMMLTLRFLPSIQLFYPYMFLSAAEFYLGVWVSIGRAKQGE